MARDVRALNEQLTLVKVHKLSLYPCLHLLVRSFLPSLIHLFVCSLVRSFKAHAGQAQQALHACIIESIALFAVKSLLKGMLNRKFCSFAVTGQCRAYWCRKEACFCCKLHLGSTTEFLCGTHADALHESACLLSKQPLAMCSRAWQTVGLSDENTFVTHTHRTCQLVCCN